MLEQTHDEAFDEAYSYGSRRRAPRFNKRQYRRIVLKAMSQRAEADRRETIARWLANPAEYERLWLAGELEDDEQE